MYSVKYSVIIPVYNSEKFIRKILDSLLDQKYNDMEIIIVDDDSIDNTANIIREEYSHSIIRYYKKDHAGPGAAREYGYKRCNGKYVCFLDSDDYVVSNYFEKIDCVIEEDTDVLEYGYLNEDTNLVVLPEAVDAYDRFTTRLCKSKLITALWNKVFRHEVLEEIEYMHMYYHEDFYVAFQVYHNMKKIKVIPEVLYYYVNNDNSLLRKTNINIKHKIDGLYVRERLLEKYHDLTHEEKVILKTHVSTGALGIYILLINNQNYKLSNEYNELLEDIFMKSFCVDSLLHLPIKSDILMILFRIFKKRFVIIWKTWRILKVNYEKITCKKMGI